MLQRSHLFGSLVAWFFACLLVARIGMPASQQLQQRLREPCRLHCFHDTAAAHGSTWAASLFFIFFAVSLHCQLSFFFAAVVINVVMTSGTICVPSKLLQTVQHFCYLFIFQNKITWLHFGRCSVTQRQPCLCWCIRCVCCWENKAFFNVCLM